MGLFGSFSFAVPSSSFSSHSVTGRFRTFFRYYVTAIVKNENSIVDYNNCNNNKNLILVCYVFLFLTCV